MTLLKKWLCLLKLITLHIEVGQSCRASLQTFHGVAQQNVETIKRIWDHSYLGLSSTDAVISSQMSGWLLGNNHITISPASRDKAKRARETIEGYYSDLVRLKSERNERMKKINLIINQELLSEEEKLKESYLIKLFKVFAWQLRSK